MTIARTAACFFLVAALSVAASDAWDRVRSLKSGSEVRIFKREGRQPVQATFYEATEERVIVVLKNAEVSIARRDIERLDARPKTGSRVVRDSKAHMPVAANSTPVATRVGGRPMIPSQPASSGLTFGSKPEFETVYKRPSEPTDR